MPYVVLVLTSLLCSCGAEAAPEEANEACGCAPVKLTLQTLKFESPVPVSKDFLFFPTT